MRLTFVTPAWRRYDVTKLVLRQRRWLCDVLASRGITADCIVVADDDNGWIAEDYGFTWMHEPNLLGYKINRGMGLAIDRGADYVTFVGSDDWLHPDLFDVAMLDGRVVTGRKLTQYDLGTHTSKVVGTRSPFGVIPWLIPASAITEDLLSNHVESGIDILIGMKMTHLPWHFHDPHPLARVDFKTDLNMTPYGAGIGPVAPPLASRYPQHLVDEVMTWGAEVAA